MPKARTLYICGDCGYESPKWAGRCPGCGAWNTMEETVAAPAPAAKAPGKIAANQRPGTGAQALLLKDIPENTALRTSTGISELDRVLGGGIVEGGLMLIGGDPGIGKSTLLLQVCDQLASEGQRVLYVSGEESARQIRLRARRLGVTSDVYVLSENAMDAVEEKIRALQPDTAVIDSVQTMYRPEMSSAPGSVSQIRECTSLIMRLCKETGTSVFLVGHVTKDGAIAGPRILEHMVDVVLYFEGDRQQDYRLLRAVKNRFGSVNELGVFRMTGTGMQVVDNPSEELLSHRIALLLAVLEKRANLRTYNQDVYINVAGGLELSEPAADLALCAAVASSLKDRAVGPDVAVMGEVGLAGEVRAVPQCERRISECARLGFTTLIVPKTSAGRVHAPEGVKVIGVDTVTQALSILF